MVRRIPKRTKVGRDPDFADLPGQKYGAGRGPAWTIGALIVLVGAGLIGLHPRAEADAPVGPLDPGQWLIPTPLRMIPSIDLAPVEIDPGIVQHRGTEIDPRIVVDGDPEIDPGIFATRGPRGLINLRFLGPPGMLDPLRVIPPPRRIAPFHLEPRFGPWPDRPSRTPARPR